MWSKSQEVVDRFAVTGQLLLLRCFFDFDDRAVREARAAAALLSIKKGSSPMAALSFIPFVS